MHRGGKLKVGLVVCALAWLALEVGAGDPMFIRWLRPGDPGDETIRVYWERLQADELAPQEMVDLGTMLFYRGYPKDAVRMYRRALDGDDELYEAWFRMGLVEHRSGDVRRARYAYKHCLKILKGHGWCNFYLGLLEENDGHPGRALEHYRLAFKVAPELAFPEVNPEVLSSELALGAKVRHLNRESFVASMPMSFLEPHEVVAVRSRFEPQPTPPPEIAPPEAQATPVHPTPEPTPAPTGAVDSEVSGREVPGSRAGSDGAPEAGRRRMSREDFLRQRGRLPGGADGQGRPGGGRGVPDVSPESGF